jgi:predicted deacetylase
MKAHYLLRFDDICPTMNWHIWDDVEKILCDLDIQPIVAIVPDNQDTTLRVCEPNRNFWDRAREWQARGWTIAMHGWQHRFVSRNSGILRLQPCSEFAGLSREDQESKLRRGLSVFETESIKSDVWIAPAHSFDVVTIELLLALGFRYVSDGFFLFPSLDRFGMTWIPQQLWSFRRRPFGVWTICFHVNSWKGADLRAFRNNVNQFHEAISRFDAIVTRYEGREDSVLDSVAASLYRAGAETKAAVRQLLGTTYRNAVVQPDEGASIPR